MKYKIKNSFLEVEVNSLGAELSSIRDIEEDIEYLWQGDKTYWNRQAPILFPIVGKLKDFTLFYDDAEYQMSQHGFARDMEFELRNKSENSLEFRLASNNATKKHYPFEFELFVIYTLEDKNLTTSYKVVNPSVEKDLYFSIGAHPAFNWPYEKSPKKLYYLEFYEDSDVLKTRRLDNGLIIDKLEEKVELSESRLYLNDEIFNKDAFIFEKLKTKKVSLKNLKSKTSLSVEFDGFEYLGIWSKGNGAPFVCIEPWCGIADFESHNKIFRNKVGINKLEPLKTFERSFIIKIDENNSEENKKEKALIESQIKRIHEVLETKSNEEPKILEKKEEIKKTEPKEENSVEDLKIKEEKKKSSCEANINTWIYFFAILAVILLIFTVYLFMQKEIVREVIVEKPIEVIKVVEKEKIVKVKDDNKVAAVDIDKKQIAAEFFTSLDSETIKCYDFETAKTLITKDCETKIDEVFSKNDILKYEITPVVAEGDNILFDKVSNQVSNIDNVSMMRIKNYLLRGLSRERVLEATQYIREKYGEDILVIPSNYYVESKKYSKGVIIKAYYSHK